MLAGKRVAELVGGCAVCGGLSLGKPCLDHGIYTRYMPEGPLVLVVSESPPPGRKESYLYNTNVRDNLRVAIAKALSVNEAEVPELLKRRGILWSTAVKCRPVRKEYLEVMRRNCVPLLRAELELLRPVATVALGRTARASFKSLGIRPDLEDNHPLYYTRRGDTASLRTLLLKVLGLAEGRGR